MIQVSAAIIWREGSILICQRGEGGDCSLLWEFPGGKQGAGESAEDCVRRECREELGIELRLGAVFGTAEYTYGGRPFGFTFFQAEIAGGSIRPVVHRDLCWVRPEELEQYDFCPANRDIIRRLAEKEETAQ